MEMSLYVDKYRPKRLSELLNKDVASRLIKLAEQKDFPHLFFYGPSGSGKKTYIKAFLRELFGDKIDNLKSETRKFNLPNKTVEVPTLSSEHHIEVSVTDTANSDRIIIQEIVKDIAGTSGNLKDLVTTNKKNFFDVSADKSCVVDVSGDKGCVVDVSGDDSDVGGVGVEVGIEDNYVLESTKKICSQFRVIVLWEVDKLSKWAQHALRRTMETNSQKCRLILCCDSPSQIMEPVRSRCLCIRISAPTINEIKDILCKVSEQEGFIISNELAHRIAHQSNRNLKGSLLSLQTLKKSYDMTNEICDVSLPDWEIETSKIADKILSEQTPHNILEIRERFYELLGHCIPADSILKKLVTELIQRCDEALCFDLVTIASTYDSRIREGSKPIFHLEAFVASFMEIYHNYTQTLMCDR